jgi:hypothetical protein
MDRPIEFQEFEAPRFQDNRHMKVVRLLAACTLGKVMKNITEKKL